MGTIELQKARQEFAALTGRLKAFEYATALANWDVSTLAPPKGKQAAAKSMGVLSGEIFALKTSPEMRGIIETYQAHSDSLTEVEARQTELLAEELEKLEKIPQTEYQEFSELQQTAMVVWEEAKSKDDFGMFAPYLEKILHFTRRFAGLTKPGIHPYEACLDDYEKGQTMEELDRFFAAVREKTVPLVNRIAGEGRDIRDDFLRLSYPVGKQQEISKQLLGLIGFDLDMGVLAASEHPFTNEINSGDVRLTTHYYENNLTSAMLSTVHEGGHGIYEQKAKLSPLVGGTTLDGGVSMAIHESQSRFYENFICRGRAFWEYYFPTLRETYPDQLGDVALEEFYRAINIARPGYIRIEADELTYNLHIMVRYELEKGLVAGDIAVADLPRLWNERYGEYLGLTPRSNREGVLQDVHWSGGMIGYFPSYALGNAYAAQLTHTMKQHLDFDAVCRSGSLAPITDWLGENVHRYGSLKTPGRLIKEITGEALNPAYLTDYLEEKFAEIYF